MIDLTNQKFGRLKVVGRDGYHIYPSGKRRAKWLCQCDCGNLVSVVTSDLKNAHTQSCGCLRKETTALLKQTHCQCESRLYSIWCGMKNRCYNSKQSNFRYYGARGIAICDEWREDFCAFYSWAIKHGYKDNLSLDRININDGYYPQNCRWVTVGEQSLNRSNNHLIQYNDKTQSIKEWSGETGIAYDCLFYRLEHGWTVRDALTTPSKKYTSTRQTNGS